ncbi:MAG: right-handed parallel beta-helix repeat-containing protein [Pseudomonadota bacterium]
MIRASGGGGWSCWIRGLAAFFASAACLCAAPSQAAALNQDTGDAQLLSGAVLSRYEVPRPGEEKIYQLPKGLFLVTEALRLPSNSSLQGDGPETVLKPAPQFTGSRFITNADFERGNTDITLSGFKVVFGVKELPGSLPGLMRFENVGRLSIHDITIEADTKYFCIDLSAAARKATIRSCRIVNQGSGGCIQVRNRLSRPDRGSSEIVISGNLVASAVDEPIAAFGWLGTLSRVIVEDNTVNASGAAFGITAYGIDSTTHTGHLDHVAILGNVVTGSRNGAIAAKGGARRVQIRDNRIRQTLNDGIFIDSGGAGLPAVHSVDVSGNTIEDAGRHGVYARGQAVSIRNNWILRSRGAGIFISGKGGGRVDALNNRISAAGRSIIIYGTVLGNIEGNHPSTPLDILRLEE